MITSLRSRQPIGPDLHGRTGQVSLTVTAPLATLARAAALAAIVIAAVEGPLRLGLHAVNLDAAIFLRDLLFLIVPLQMVFLRKPGTPIPFPIAVFALLVMAHGLVSLFNLGQPMAVLYGIKLFLPLLCGLLLPGVLLAKSRGGLALFGTLWLATVAGAAFEKFTDWPMPWIGVSAEMLGVDVFLGRDWNSGAVKRVAGLTRSSINLAVLLPFLSLVLMAHTKNRLLRVAITAFTLVVLIWSTQKGAILAFGLATLVWALCATRRALPLRLLVMAFALVTVLGPVLGIHVQLSREQGVFSLESFIERLEYMWPMAWQWIDRFPPWLGVGLGGIGGAQRFYAPEFFNPADNLFIFLYANAGPLAVAYVTWLVLKAVTHPWRDTSRDGLVLASLAFLLGYGAVISLIEDQIAALWLGAVIGSLSRDASTVHARDARLGNKTSRIFIENATQKARS